MKRALRRRYLVDRALQGRLIVHALLYGAMVIALFCGGVFAPVLWQLGARDHAVSYEAATVMLYMHESFWPIVLLCAVAVTIGSVRFSHRIAGPLVRYKRNLRMLAEGKLTPALRTRNGDLLQDEVAALNGAMKGVATRVDAMRSAQLALRRELTIVLDGCDAETRQRLVPLVDACDELELAVRGFRHVDPGDERAAPVVAAVAEAVPGC
ncbi:MAG: hypothetical protein R3F29_12755 [Planctomycetota bacterium]